MNAIRKTSEEVVYDVVDEIAKVLYAYIMEYTYGDLPNKQYWKGEGIPSWQFLNAFKLTNVQQKMNEIVSELYYDWQSMDYDPGTYLHGSYYTGDMREVLAEVLNIEGITGFSNKTRHPYWDIFIEEMFDKDGIGKLFDKYMKEEFSKIGINIVRTL
jgi:hypothetical protein